MKPDNRRSHPRITTLMPFQVRRILSGEREKFECGISTAGIVIDGSPPPPVDDERLSLWLNMLNAKLDYLLSIAPLKEEGVVSMSFEPLNISGSGMSMITEEAFQEGDFLEIKMVLQSYPTKILDLYGEVVRVSPTPQRPELFTIGVRFVNISEAVREEIMNFDFRKHRKKMLLTSKSQ